MNQFDETEMPVWRLDCERPTEAPGQADTAPEVRLDETAVRPAVPPSGMGDTIARRSTLRIRWSPEEFWPIQLGHGRRSRS